MGTILTKRVELHMLGVGTPTTHKCVVTRQVPGQQFRERADQTAIVGFSFDVLIPQAVNVECIEPIATNEGDGIAESGFHHRVASRQPKTKPVGVVASHWGLV